MFLPLRAGLVALAAAAGVSVAFVTAEQSEPPALGPDVVLERAGDGERAAPPRTERPVTVPPAPGIDEPENSDEDEREPVRRAPGGNRDGAQDPDDADDGAREDDGDREQHDTDDDARENDGDREQDDTDDGTREDDGDREDDSEGDDD